MLETKQKLVNSIVFAKYEEHALKVIEHIKALPDSCRLSGDDSGLKDVWEEFKFQLQDQHSIYFDAYEETIRQICYAVADSLPPNEMHLLWLWSDGYVEWDEEDERHPPYDAYDVAKELYSTVCKIGMDEPLARDAAEAEEEDGEEVSVPILIRAELTPGWGGERWSVADVIDERDGRSIGDIGVHDFDAHSDFPNTLLNAVLRTLQDEELFEGGIFYSVTVNIREGGTDLGQASANFWGDDLPPLH